MHARRLLLLAAWIGTLTLLAWAASPPGVRSPAPAWDATTFPSRLEGGAPRRFAAPEGGYAPAFLPRTAPYRARRSTEEEDAPSPPRPAAPARVAGDYRPPQG